MSDAEKAYQAYQQAREPLDLILHDPESDQAPELAESARKELETAIHHLEGLTNE